MYYNILFLLTILLTPVFCVFEFIALCTSLFYAPEHFGGELRARGPTVTIIKDEDEDDYDWLGAVSHLDGRGKFCSNRKVETTARVTRQELRRVPKKPGEEEVKLVY